MKTTLCLVTTFLSMALDTTSASQLRGGPSGVAEGQRDLQAANLLNQLTTVFIPALSQNVQTMAQQEYDPLILTNETSHEIVWSSASLGDFVNDTAYTGLELLPIACNTSANITMSPSELTGLGSVVVNSMELIPGTEDIQTELMGLGGVKWSGVWLVDASFASDLVLSTRAAVDGDLCGMPVQQTMDGSISIVNPVITMKMFMAGNTGSIVVARQSTSVEILQVQDANVTFDALKVAMDANGNSLNMNFDMSFFNKDMIDAMVENSKQMMVEMMQEGINENIPFSP